MENKLIIIILLFFLIFLFLRKKERFTEIKKYDFIPIDALTSYKDKKDTILLFKKLIDLLHKNDIQYWCIGGTLLGAIRDKGMISWDDDADIGVMKDDIYKIINLKEDLEKMDLGLVSWFGGYKVFEKKGKSIENKNFKYPFVDIFSIIKKEDIYKFESELANELWPLERYVYEDLFPLKKVLFEYYEIFVPNRSIELLNKIFPNWNNVAKKTYDHTVHKKVSYDFDIYYDKNKKPYLWLYWDNINTNKTPDMIELCYESVKKHCSRSFEIVRLNKDNIKRYLPELENYERYMKDLIIAHKVDIYRIMLLYKYGGMYLDSDIIVMKDPIEVMNKLKIYDFVGFGCSQYKCKNGYGNPSNWLLVSRPVTNLMGNILKEQIEMIKGNKKISYHDIGKLLIWQELDKLIKNDNYEYYQYSSTLDGTRDKYGNWVTTQRLFSEKEIEYDNPDDFIFLVYYNSEDSKGFKINNLLRKEILNKNYQITKFIKKSLNL